MLNLGIIRPSKSNWSSPLHIAPKPNGRGWRPCGDFRRLNSRTVDDMQDFAAILEGKTIFSKIDLICGYRHIPLNESDIPKTAVTTPFGPFEFLLFMPF